MTKPRDRRIFLIGAAALAAMPGSVVAATVREGFHVRPGKLAARMLNWSRQSTASLRSALDKKVPAVVKWYLEIKGEKQFSRSELDLLYDINLTVNSTIRYRKDWEHWHRRDYWEPVVTAIVEGGDCEDYALCKAAALHLDGWPHDRVRLLVGLHTAGGRRNPHAILMAKTKSGRDYVLDNLANRVVPLASYRNEFIPYYSLDDTGDTILYEAGLKDKSLSPARNTPSSK